MASSRAGAPCSEAVPRRVLRGGGLAGVDDRSCLGRIFGPRSTRVFPHGPRFGRLGPEKEVWAKSRRVSSMEKIEASFLSFFSK